MFPYHLNHCIASLLGATTYKRPMKKNYKCHLAIMALETRGAGQIRHPLFSHNFHLKRKRKQATETGGTERVGE